MCGRGGEHRVLVRHLCSMLQYSVLPIGILKESKRVQKIQIIIKKSTDKNM